MLKTIAAHSDYSKYDPYLFDPEGFYKHGKNKAFESWGYTITDAQWLKDEIERQARERYTSGEYTLGKLIFVDRESILESRFLEKTERVRFHSLRDGWSYLMVN